MLNTAVMTTLRPTRRYITTHRSDGKSTYLPTDQANQLVFPVPTKLAAGRSYAVSSVPAKLGEHTDLKEWNSEDSITSYKSQAIRIPAGVNVSVLNLESGGSSAMHQTVTLDYSICVAGAINHELDSGEVVTLKPGVCSQDSFLSPDQEQPDSRYRTISFREGQITGGAMPHSRSRQD